jgi:hypothetical protein
VDGWMGVKAVLKIAYSNLKPTVFALIIYTPVVHFTPLNTCFVQYSEQAEIFYVRL